MGEYERFFFSLKKNKSSPFWGAESEKNPPGSLSQTFIHSPENVSLFFTDEKNIKKLRTFFLAPLFFHQFSGRKHRRGNRLENRSPGEKSLSCPFRASVQLSSVLYSEKKQTTAVDGHQMHIVCYDFII